ncbi:DUF4276 family protein [Persicitalea sp.]|uniref:DUF4276 family protein n=1 Tax=Persicitalea sp. TaxID=3100273 RepID=UPI0035932542
MAAKKIILFIEGEPNSSNGDLRQGFTKLLEQKLTGKLPKIILGGGKEQTIDKFLNNRLAGDIFLLLLDLDDAETQRNADLRNHRLESHSERVFYMIQEMEAWFLSQPEVLDKFYGLDKTGKTVSEKLSKRKAEEIANPKEELIRITQNPREGGRGEYQIIKHAVELLKLLDANKLEKDSADFRKLVQRIVS